MVAHHHYLTRGHLIGSSCHLSRALLCHPTVQELYFSHQSLITSCVWSLLGACTANMSCAKGQARSLPGGQLSIHLLSQLQEGVNGFCLACHSTQIPTTRRMICKSWPSFVFLFLGFIRLFLGVDWNHNKTLDFKKIFRLVGFSTSNHFMMLSRSWSKQRYFQSRIQRLKYKYSGKIPLANYMLMHMLLMK